jgi:hypothetical protein
MNMAVFVTMTDKFMSGWGPATGLINKLVIECDTAEQAQICAKNARKRGEMKRVSITSRKPQYRLARYLVSYKKFSQLGTIWTVDQDNNF